MHGLFSHKGNCRNFLGTMRWAFFIQEETLHNKMGFFVVKTRALSQVSLSSMVLFYCKVLPSPYTLLGALSLYLLIIVPLQASSATAPTSIIFNGFDGSNISLSGVAKVDGELIKLTNISSRLFGRAFYPYPLHMKNKSSNVVSSFSTAFVFCITPLLPTIGGHGMAFVMAPSLDSHDIFPSQYLGMLNATDNGNTSNHVFGVEFDTVQDLEFMDINDNHVGINLNSMISTNSSAAGYWPDAASHQNASQNASKTLISLKSGDIIQAWIEYDGHSQQLNVTIAPVRQPKPHIPLLSVGVNLSDVLQEYMFVGFSASTGVMSGIHRVLSWSFNSNGVARSLDLSKLPSIFPETPLLKTTHFKVAISISVVISSLLLGSVVALFLYKRSQREVVESWELEFGLHRYSYKDLKKATRGFHDSELLGVGGFGRVYRGIVPGSGLEVAVKRLSRDSAQGEKEFIAEIASTGRLRHRNLVQLLGWSRQKGQLLLVYEFMPNGSLDKMLFGKSSQVLRWEQRQRIITGVAAGILYLHEGWEQQVLHRDVKASNVLLDAEMHGRLGDFGLARLYEHGQNPHTTRVVGTLGYMAPEFARTGKATTSMDVYSFGLLLLEVMTGRRPIEHRIVKTDQGTFLLLEWVWDLHTKGRLLEAVDVKLEGLFVVEEAEKILLLGLQCSHPDPSARPSMRQVLQILRNEAPHISVSPLLQANFISPMHQYRLNKADGDQTSFTSSSIKSWSTLDPSTTLISAR